MEEINARIRELRTALGFSQEQMGKVLYLTRSGVCDIEAGRRKVTESHIIMLKNYNDKIINEDWLRTGNGQMFRTLTRNQEFEKFINDVIEEPDNSFRKRFMDALSKLTVNEWKALETITDSLTRKS